MTPLLNVLMVQNDILVEPPYGTLYGVTSGSKLGFVKASGHRKSLMLRRYVIGSLTAPPLRSRSSVIVPSEVIRRIALLSLLPVYPHACFTQKMP